MVRKQLTDAEYHKKLIEGAQLNTAQVQMGTYTAPADADKLIAKDSTADNLSDIITKVTDGFGGEAVKGNVEGEVAKVPAGAPAKGDANGGDLNPSDLGTNKSAGKQTFEKGEGEEGQKPTVQNPAQTTPNTGKDALPPDSGKSNKIVVGEDVIDENETEILEKLIAEMSKIEDSIVENFGDEFDDGEDLDLDIDISESEDLDEDIDLEFSDVDVEDEAEYSE